MENRIKRFVAIALGAVALVGVNAATMDTTQIPMDTELNTEIENVIESTMDTEIESIIEPSIDIENGRTEKISVSAYVVVNKDTNSVTAGTSFGGYGGTCEATVRIYYRVGETYYYSESTNSTAQPGGTSATVTKKDAEIVGAEGIHRVTYGDITWTPVTSVGTIPASATKE